MGWGGRAGWTKRNTDGKARGSEKPEGRGLRGRGEERASKRKIWWSYGKGVCRVGRGAWESVSVALEGSEDMCNIYHAIIYIYIHTHNHTFRFIKFLVFQSLPPSCSSSPGVGY